MKLVLRMFFLMIFMHVGNLQAQDEKRTATIIGTVRSNDGETLPFASVFVEGTAISTATNEAGIYKIIVPSNVTFTLVIKYTGFVDFNNWGHH